MLRLHLLTKRKAMNKILIFVILLLSGCAVTGNISEDRRTIVLKGWGATQASWEKDGEKYSISKQEALKVPDIIPTR